MTKLLTVALLALRLIDITHAEAAEQREKKVAAPKFGSTVIYVESGVREVLEFYKTAFGVPIRYYDDKLQFGELETGQTSIMIASYIAGEYMVGDKFQSSVTKRPADIEIAFVMSDVPSAYATAVAAGANAVREPRMMPWGQTVAYVSSIEGTLIGLLSPLPLPKPQ